MEIGVRSAFGFPRWILKTSIRLSASWNARDFFTVHMSRVAKVIFLPVQVLLHHGANVEDHNENGHTPLMEAASAGHVEVAKVKSLSYSVPMKMLIFITLPYSFNTQKTFYTTFTPMKHTFILDASFKKAHSQHFTFWKGAVAIIFFLFSDVAQASIINKKQILIFLIYLG